MGLVWCAPQATNVRLTLVVLPVLPIALIIFMAFGAITMPLFGELQRRLSGLNTILQENLAGIKVVKAFARETQQQAKFDASADYLMWQQIKVARTFSFIFPLVFLLMNFCHSPKVSVPAMICRPPK